MTRIADIMTKSVATIGRDDTLQAAAKRMREMDVGSLPVLDGSAIAGMVTDRDIAIRGVAEGMVAQEARVADVMTDGLHWCTETDTVDAVMAKMGKAQVRRVVVFDADHKLVGIVAVADLATRQSADTDGVVREISSPEH